MMQIATTRASITLKPTHEVTSRFVPFVMSDGEHAGTDESWVEYHGLILALQDALEELENFGSYRNELRELLRETGFHDVARLRKQTDLLLFTDEEFDTVLGRLADAGCHEIALKAEAVRERQRKASRGQAPKVSTEAKRQLITKLESLATSSNPNEAASAQRKAEEIKTRYEIESSDPFESILAELDAPIRLTPSAELARELDEAWTKLRPLGDIYYDVEEAPERMQKQLIKRVNQLEKLVREHTLLKRHKPIVEQRR